MANVMLGRILRAPRVKEGPHLVLDIERIVAHGDYVILMKDMAEKMSII
jgi:hypothetical protein